VVGLAVSGPTDPGDAVMELLALGVAPAFRRQGLAARLLEQHVVSGTIATVTLAERDVIDPLPRETRAAITQRLLERAGFEIEPTGAPVRRIDPLAITVRRP
jgi:ribosomal protein S18 acetylase RimI-like enzyme